MCIFLWNEDTCCKFVIAARTVVTVAVATAVGVAFEVVVRAIETGFVNSIRRVCAASWKSSHFMSWILTSRAQNHCRTLLSRLLVSDETAIL